MHITIQKDLRDMFWTQRPDTKGHTVRDSFIQNYSTVKEIRPLELGMEDVAEIT